MVATANDVAQLPPELLRRGRFDELFFVDLPTVAERREILAIHLTKRGRQPDHYRLAELAEQAERFTGAELEQAVITALYTAFAEGRDLEEDDLANALTATVPLACVKICSEPGPGAFVPKSRCQKAVEPPAINGECTWPGRGCRGPSIGAAVAL